MNRIVKLLVVACLLAVLGSIGASTASAASAPATTTESRYLDQLGTLIDRDGQAGDDLQTSMTLASADIYLIFDADWQADLTSTCADFDAIYHDAKELTAPRRFTKVNRYFVASNRQMTLACDDLMTFLTDYDAAHLTAANAHIAKGTTYTERATKELKRLTPDDSD